MASSGGKGSGTGSDAPGARVGGPEYIVVVVVLVLVVVAATVVAGVSEVDVDSVDVSSFGPQPEITAVESTNPITTDETVERKRTFVILTGGLGIL